jgi:hypothetical protein
MLALASFDFQAGIFDCEPGGAVATGHCSTALLLLVVVLKTVGGTRVIATRFESRLCVEKE